MACGASAELFNCGLADVERIMVQGERETSHGHENTLLVELSKNGSDVLCSGKNYVYMSNSNPSYSGALSVLLAAQAQNRQVSVTVNTTVIKAGNAVEMAFISLSR